MGFVVCGGAALLDLVGVDDAATDDPPWATADPEATDDGPWVPPVPVALWCVELHAANAYPQIASSTGTAHRRYIAMSSTPPVVAPIAPVSIQTVTCLRPRRRRSRITFTISTCPILFGSNGGPSDVRHSA